MKKLFLVAPILLLSLLVGCVSTSPIIQTSVVTTTVTNTVKAVPTTVVNTVTVIKVIDPISGNEYILTPGDVGTANANARATGYYNGYSAHWNGLVLNGEDTENQFNISVTPYVSPDYPDSPAGVADWVVIENPNLVDGVLTVPAMSVGTLYITLDVPEGIQLPAEWGFLVHVARAIGGNVIADNAIRWIVVMQNPS